MKILTYDPKKQKKVFCGTYYPEKYTFIREVDPSIHFMERVQGYGIQETAFQNILKRGCVNIILKSPTDEYYAPLQTWIDNGRVMDFGNGKQRFLSMKYMRLRRIKIEYKDTTAVVTELFEDIT